MHSSVGMQDKSAVVTNHLLSVFVHLAVFILRMRVRMNLHLCIVSAVLIVCALLTTN